MKCEGLFPDEIHAHIVGVNVVQIADELVVGVESSDAVRYGVSRLGELFHSPFEASHMLNALVGQVGFAEARQEVSRALKLERLIHTIRARNWSVARKF